VLIILTDEDVARGKRGETQNGRYGGANFMHSMAEFHRANRIIYVATGEPGEPVSHVIKDRDSDRTVRACEVDAGIQATRSSYRGESPSELLEREIETMKSMPKKQPARTSRVILAGD
jgi:hypothetical protein